MHRILRSLLPSLCLLATLLPIANANAQLIGVGPVDPAHGFPTSYTDSQNTRLDLCLNNSGLCLLTEAVQLLDPAQPFPGNYGGTFPDESFYWAGSADLVTNGGGQALLIMALEAAFANGSVIPGEQITFGRMRIRADNLVVGATYTITTPYGTFTEVATRAGRRSINFTRDIGLIPGEFTGAMNSGIGPFLRWDSGLPIFDTLGNTYIGDPNQLHTVTGSPTGNNVFRIDGPNVGGPGIDTISTDLFSIMGLESAALPPVASFTIAPSTGVAPLSVTFSSTSTGTISDVLWNFGDGTSSTLPVANHVYAAAGTYDVTLTANGPGGTNSAQLLAAVVVTAPAVPPVASFTVAPSTGVAPLSVTFTSTSTGTISDLLWNFGDGSTSTLPVVNHVYAAAGTYDVSLTVNGPGGSNSAQQLGAVVVTQPALPPVAAFSAAPASGQAPLSVTFTDASTGTITAYAWTFGDGTTSTVASPVHVYQTAGTFTVGLTVTGPGGANTLSLAGLVTVTAPPAPTNPILAAPTPGTAGVVNAFPISGCTPGATISLMIGTGAGNGSITIGGRRFRTGLTQPSVLATGVAGPDGSVTLNVAVPANLRNRTRSLQVYDRSSLRLSNVVSERF